MLSEKVYEINETSVLCFKAATSVLGFTAVNEIHRPDPKLQFGQMPLNKDGGVQ